MSEVWEELYEQRDRLRCAIKRISDNEEGRQLLTERTHDHERELAFNHEAFLALVELVDRQQERIKRLENIVLGLTAGICSTYPDAGELHTHQVYLANGVMALVNEIKGSRFIGEEPEPNGARFAEEMLDEAAERCPRCGDSTSFMLAPSGDLCPECESELAKEQAILHAAGWPWDY